MKKLVVIVSILVLAMGLAACSSGNGSTGSTGTSSGSSSSGDGQTAQSDTALGVGDTVTVDDIQLTLTSVSLTDERNQFADTDPAYVVKIEYTIVNNSTSDYPFGLDLDVYGPDGKKADTYPNENSMGSLASGKATDCVVHYGINDLGKIEIQFSPLFSSKKAIFEATV